MSFANISQVTVGTRLVADGGFTCIDAGAILTVERADDGELFVPCACGTHGLEGQIDDEGGEIVGLSLAA